MRWNGYLMMWPKRCCICPKTPRWLCVCKSRQEFGFNPVTPFGLWVDRLDDFGTVLNMGEKQLAQEIGHFV